MEEEVSAVRVRKAELRAALVGEVRYMPELRYFKVAISDRHVSMFS